MTRCALPVTASSLFAQKKAKEKVKPKEEITWDDIEFSDEEIEAAGDAWIQQQIDIRRGK